MFNELFFTGNVSLKDGCAILLEGVKDLFNEMLYYISKFELIFPLG